MPYRYRIYSGLIIGVVLLIGCASTRTEDDPVALKKQLAELEQKLSVQEREEQLEIEKTKKTYDHLVASLKNEIGNKKIEITQYKGILTINIIDDIFFDSGRAEIRKESVGVLDRVGNIAKILPDKIIQIEGHTDDMEITEENKYKFPNNWSLGARRAINVALYFENVMNIDPLRLVVMSFSKYRPLVPDTNAENRAKNRRIEIVLVDRSLYQKLEMKRGIK